MTALVADPSDPKTFYASVTSPTNKSAAGVYVSKDSGQTWSAVFTSGTLVSGGANVFKGATDQLVPKLATGPNGAVAIAVADIKPTADNPSAATLTGLYLSKNKGGSWSALAVPVTNPGAQGIVNLAVAIDPKNTSVVYVAGDAIASPPYTVAAFRVQGDVAVSLANHSTAHADARALIVNAAGTLMMGSDGGVYLRAARKRTPASGKVSTQAPCRSVSRSLSSTARTQIELRSRRRTPASQSNPRRIAHFIKPFKAAMAPLQS